MRRPVHRVRRRCEQHRRERYGAAHFAVGDLLAVAQLADRADGAFCIGNVLPHLPHAALDRFLADLARAVGLTLTLVPDSPLLEKIDSGTLFE